VLIESLDVRGFRGLRGRYEFSRSLTVVVGDNESGKSSLHEVLIRTLFGFSKAERRRAKGAPSLLERRAPWDGSPYRAVGQVRKDDRVFRIEWDFKSNEVRLIDELGQDVSHEIRGMRDDVGLGEFLFGMGLDDFHQVCCIDQEALLAVRHSPSLGVALQEAVANVAADVPVEEAVEALNNFLRTAIGARVDNFNPSPRGRLNALLREADVINQDLAAAEDARTRLVGISRERVKAREQHDAALVELERTRQVQLLMSLRSLESRLQEAQRLSEAAAKRPAEASVLDERAVDAVKAARSRVLEIAEQIPAVEKEGAAAAEAVAALEQEQRTLVGAVDGLAPYADIDDRARDRVQAAWSQLDALQDEAELVDPPIPERDSLLQRYREERTKVVNQASQVKKLTPMRVLWIALVVATLGLAWLVRWAVERIRGKRTDPIADLLSPYGASSIEELDSKVAEEDKRIIEAEAVAKAYQEKREEHAKRQATLSSDIEGALSEVGAPDTGSLADRVRAYLTAAAKHAELTANRAELERVRRELADARRPEVELERIASESAKTQETLRGAYRALGIDEADLDQAAGSFEQLVVEAQAQVAQEQDAEKAAAALAAALQGDSLDELKDKVSKAERAFEEHRAAHGELATQPDEPESLRASSEDLEKSLRLHVKQAAELETLAKQLEEEAGDPAVLKEKLADVQEQIGRLNQAKDAVRIARTMLTEAAEEQRREFAPYLNKALAANVARITGERYTEAGVDSELAVSVVAPETGSLKSADDLSRATKDQLFLVQRLEIARLLTPTKGTPPLLLDDPFAHYDEERMRYGLELVAEAAEERQIILFSEDRSLVESARQVCPSCEVIELATPAKGGSLATAKALS
jgi:DNA repair protein SbcC/Rad50